MTVTHQCVGSEGWRPLSIPLHVRYTNQGNSVAVSKPTGLLSLSAAILKVAAVNISKPYKQAPCRTERKVTEI